MAALAKGASQRYNTVGWLALQSPLQWKWSAPMKRALWLGGALLAMLWLLSARAPVDAQAWQPPPNPGLTGAFAPNQALAAITEISVGTAPEHVACGADGALYTSLDGGAVLRGNAKGQWDVIGNTEGRPLGLRTDGKGGLWIADSMKGSTAYERHRRDRGARHRDQQRTSQICRRS